MAPPRRLRGRCSRYQRLGRAFIPPVVVSGEAARHDSGGGRQELRRRRSKMALGTGLVKLLLGLGNLVFFVGVPRP